MWQDCADQIKSSVRHSALVGLYVQLLRETQSKLIYRQFGRGTQLRRSWAESQFNFKDDKRKQNFWEIVYNEALNRYPTQWDEISGETPISWEFNQWSMAKYCVLGTRPFVSPSSGCWSSLTFSAAPLSATTRLRFHCISRRSRLGKGSLSGSCVETMKTIPFTISLLSITRPCTCTRQSSVNVLCWLVSASLGCSRRSTSGLLSLSLS